MRAPLLAAAAGAAAVPRARADCYSANIPSFSHCGDAEVRVGQGYNCSADGVMCAAASCIKQCEFCALHYRGAVLHEETGQCCDSVSGGVCRGPKAAQIHNEPYGLTDHKAAVLFEGPVAYPHGPAVWSPEHPSGAYGWSMNFPPVGADGGCPPVPAQFDAAKVRAANLKKAGAQVDNCFLACNLTEVAATGEDPCKVGSVSSPTAGHGAMSCFSGGDTWLTPPHTGMCAFNCTAKRDDDPSRYCDTEDVIDLCHMSCHDSLL